MPRPAELATLDTMSHHENQPNVTDPHQYWENRYGGKGAVWTGKVNSVLAEVGGRLPVGRALDLGCGEGGDVIWLAKQGWSATGIDISQNAVRRAQGTAQAEGLSEKQARFVAGDLTDLGVRGEFDLVTASFFQSPVALDRRHILRKASQLVGLGGHFLITSHAVMPHHPNQDSLVKPQDEVAGLALSPDSWELVISELRPRTHTDRDGNELELEDSVVLYKRI